LKRVAAGSTPFEKIFMTLSNPNGKPDALSHPKYPPN